MVAAPVRLGSHSMSTPHRFAKHFTLDEANAWLPRLRSGFVRLHEAIDALQGDLAAIHSTVERRGNGGGIDVQRWSSGDRVINTVLSEMQDAGIVLQDVHRGLIDFPHLAGGGEVFLCWELADGDTLEWFHEIEAGFAGRRPLDELDQSGP